MCSGGWSFNFALLKALLSLKPVSRRKTFQRVIKPTGSDSWALPGIPNSSTLFRLLEWAGGWVEGKTGRRRKNERNTRMVEVA